MSYLLGSYLEDGEEFDAGGATVALSEAPDGLADDRLPAAAPGSDVITLPGGIVIPKRTLVTVVIAVVIAAAVVYYMRRRDRLAAEAAAE